MAVPKRKVSKRVSQLRASLRFLSTRPYFINQESFPFFSNKKNKKANIQPLPFFLSNSFYYYRKLVK